MIVNERGDRVNVHDVQVEYGSVHQILDVIMEMIGEQTTHKQLEKILPEVVSLKSKSSW